MKRRITARGTAVRLATAISFESLELRRMLNCDTGGTGYQLDSTLADFGALNIATQGNLALIGSGSGTVSLVDTSTGQLLQAFHDPAASPGNFFGAAAAF